MSLTTSLPRTVLHPLEPYGLGTGQVESLTSYFCRLANSHSCTTTNLAQFVVDSISPGRWKTHNDEEKSRFVWYQRSVSGVASGALTWASVLSELTGVAGLDRLTLLPISNVVSPKALMAQSARWCPHCFGDDQRNGDKPFFRLAWDVGVVKTCAKHRCLLFSSCPHCKSSNVRHAAAFVIPGWCTSCNCFLGDVEQSQNPPSIAPNEEVYYQQSWLVSELLASISAKQAPELCPSLEGLHFGIDTLVSNLSGGNAAHFAARLGVGKSTVHYWQNFQGPLTLDALMRIAIHCNISLSRLIQGNLDGWEPTQKFQQLGLQIDYPEAKKYRDARKHNWRAIRQILRRELGSPVVKSMTEIGKELDIDDRHLYIRLPKESRLLGERYVKHLHSIAMENQKLLQEELQRAAEAIHAGDFAVTVPTLKFLLGEKTINSVRSLYSAVSNINAELDD